jgi:hypothetical protein
MTANFYKRLRSVYAVGREMNMTHAITHVVYLVMVIGYQGIDTPKAMSTEPTIAGCTAMATEMASIEDADNIHSWYCQPATARVK